VSDFLIRSLVASAILTVLLNVGLWLWSRGRRPTGRRDRPRIRRPEPGPVEHEAPIRPSVRVYVPWKAMLVLSIGLTILLNAVVALSR
jgi:hypothetical protein